jgi:hypothetical protein
MQSTKASSVQPARRPAEINWSFWLSCGMGAVTVVLGLAALAYQFAPDFNKLKPHVSQGNLEQTTTRV